MAAAKEIPELGYRPAPYAALSGRLLPRNYVLFEPIGLGTRTVVFRSAQSVLGRAVAVKMLDPARPPTDEEVATLLKRAQAAASLSSPAALEIYDVGWLHDEFPYFVMELIRGASLWRTSYRAPLEARRAAAIVLQVLTALEEMHARGQHHGRIDAYHVFIEPRGPVDRVKLALAGETWTPMPQTRLDEMQRADVRGAIQVLHDLVNGVSSPPPESGDLRLGARTDALPSTYRDVLRHGLSLGFDTAEEAIERLQALLSHDHDAHDEGPTGAAPVWIRCPACGAAGFGRHCGACGASLEARRLGDSPTIPSRPTTAGRDDVVTRLRAIREQMDGGLEVVELRGAIGSGRTRLLQTIENEARADGDVVVFAEADPYGAKVPGYAASECLRSLWQVAGEQKSSPGDRVEAKDLRAAVQVAGGFAQSGRVVLLVDDADDWDPSSLLAIAGLRNTGNEADAVRKVLVVLAARPEWSGLLRRDDVETLRLDELPATEFAALVSRDTVPLLQRAGVTTPMHAKQVEWFQRECGESPPGSLAEILAARIQLTDVRARNVLEAIALAGRRLLMVELIQLVRREDIQEHVTHLQSRGLVTVRADGIACAHPLIRAVTLETTPIATRRLLAARILAHLEGVPLEARLHVARVAGRVPLVCELARAAAERAASRGDLAASSRFLEISLQTIREHALLRRRAAP